MCYYLAVAFFDWKIGVFQQTVVSVVLMIVFLIKPDFFKGKWVLFHRFELSFGSVEKSKRNILKQSEQMNFWT